MPLSETILVIGVLLTVAMVAAALCRNLPIPFTVFLVLIGMGLHTLGDALAPLAPIGTLQLTPDLVFFVFLPALIFESALNLDARQLVRDLAPILALAIPALLVSAALVGLGTWSLLGVELTVALLFGALISATDPVAVVALFKELGAPVRLTTLVEGESLFNDATAIVLFHILLALALAGGGLGWTEVGAGAGEFGRVFFGGALLGVLLGFGISELMRRLRASPLSILVMSLVMAYVSFVVAEHYLHVSGVMATLSAALALGVYAVTRIPQAALRMIRETWEVLALVCNSLLFLMIGLSVDLAALAGRLPEIGLVALLVLAGRAVAVYPLVPAATRLFRLPAVRAGERHIMWWGGLKGGLAIAIVLSLPQTLPARQLLIELTLGVVLFTLLVNAPTIRPLIRLFGIDRLTAEERAELARGMHAAGDDARAVLEALRGADILAADTHADIAAHVDATFSTDSVEAGADRAVQRAFLEAVRMEVEELERLFQIGLLDEYTYLDLRSTLRRDRQRWSGAETQATAGEPEGANPFVRVETAILRRLREQNWASALLAHYQRLRLSQRLQRYIAGILICQAVLRGLESQAHVPAQQRQAVAEVYRRRLDKRLARVAAIRREFPGFYARFERRFFQRAALTSARRRIEADHHHGALPAKAFVRIERRIEHALADLPELPAAVPRLGPHELIRRVPMFSTLSAALVEKLAARAQPVSFLPGDVVIGEAERGSSLYIIMHGTVAVTRAGAGGGAARLATLTTGDFFGETALLGDEVRTATVLADEPVSLLRLTRRDVLAIAAEDAEFDAHLHRVAAERRARPLVDRAG